MTHDPQFSAVLLAQKVTYTQALGTCVLMWARVEVRLQLLFNKILDKNNGFTSFAIWSAVRSFEDRIAIIDATFEDVIKDEELRKNWRVLYNRAVSLSAKRNQVVHSTMVEVHKDGKVDHHLQPYFSIGKQKPPLRFKEVGEFTKEFIEFDQSIMWIVHAVLYHLKLDTKVPPQIPDLILRLRTLADRSRAKKKGRDRPSGP